MSPRGGLCQAGKQHRPFGPGYMDLRRRTEARLRELFVAAGGKPERQAPRYFVLGDSRWYEGLAEKMDHVQLPLSALPPGQTSFTYPDSFACGCRKPAPPGQMLCRSRLARSRVRVLGGQVLVRPEMG